MKKIAIDAVLFDFDGVIIDSARDIAAAVNHTLQAFGREPLTLEQIICFVGDGAETLMRRCFNGASDECISQVLPFYKDYYLQNCIIHTTLYAGVADTLDALHGKVKAVVTNKPEPLAHSILAGLGVDRQFDLVVGPESVMRMKPDPEGINKVLQQFGIDARRAVMVGDSASDIAAGKAAGVWTCAVEYGLGNLEALRQSNADMVVQSFNELLNIVE